GGYAVSTFCERTALENADAVIAVSREQRGDVLASYPAVDPGRGTVVSNGIDTQESRPGPRPDVLERHGIDPGRQTGWSVGRDTRQKGLGHLLDSAPRFQPGAQLVLCAGSPDTPEVAAEIEAKVERLRAERGDVVWVDQMLPKRDVIQLLSHAT